MRRAAAVNRCPWRGQVQARGTKPRDQRTAHDGGGGGGAAAARVHAAAPRHYGVGLRHNWPRRARAARRDRGSGGAAAVRVHAAEPRQHGVGLRHSRPHSAPELLDAIAAAAVPRLCEFTPQELANTAWAFAVADHLAPALFDSHDFVQLCAAQHGFTPKALSQLHQWQLWREERGAAWPPLPSELAQRCHAAFCQEGTPSLLQRDVAASLREIGLTPQEEVRTPQGYSLDAVVSEGEFEVAIEVDGPWHFCGRTPTAATALKRRQLRAAGWVLLPVPYWEWYGLGSSEAAKQDYLRAAAPPGGWPRPHYRSYTYSRRVASTA